MIFVRGDMGQKHLPMHTQCNPSWCQMRFTLPPHSDSNPRLRFLTANPKVNPGIFQNYIFSRFSTEDTKVILGGVQDFDFSNSQGHFQNCPHNVRTVSAQLSHGVRTMFALTN